MKHLGDITKIHGDAVPIVDVITGGSPCQDLSVAGKRAGLAGERSGLFMEQIRIIKEMRDESRKRLYDAGADYNRTDVKPRYMVWENVPGAFSSNKGEDFRAVLEETAKVADKDAVIPGPAGGKWSHAGCIMGNGWSIAWRLHDAQFWGVPQRRKRIALVADFGGESAPEILFERKGLSGDIAESAEKGQTVAGDVAESTGTTSYTLKIRGGANTYIKSDGSIGTAGKGPLVQTELSGTLGVSQDQTLIAFEPGAMSRVGGHAYEDVAGTVRANAGDNQQAVCLNPWDVQSKHIQPENGIAESLYAGECRGGGGESYVMQNQVKEWCDAVNAEAKHQQDLIQSDLGVARTLAPGTHASGPHLTKTLITSKVYGISSYDSNGMKSDNLHSGIYEADTSRTLDLNGGNPGCNQGGMAVVETIAFQGQAGAEASLQMGDDVSSTLSCTKQVMAVVYRGDSITSPINASNPMPGDPCHTLTNDSRNYVVQGADVYNGELTGEKAATLTAACGGTNTSGAKVVQGFDAYNQASTGDVAMPLRNKAADSDHIPVVCIEGNGSRPSHQGDGWHEGDPMYMLNSTEHHAVAVENHPADSRVKISDDGVVQTLSGRMGTGGGNVPMVMESQEPVVLYNNQNNAGISQNGICNTLPASAGMGGGYVPMVVEPHTFSDVAATLSAADGSKGVHSQMMKNPEQNFILETSDGEIAGTLDASYYKGCGERQGIERTVVAMTTEMTPKIDEKNKGFSLRSRDYKDPQCVAYGLDRASYNQGQNAKFGFSVDEEKVGAQTAKGPGAVCQSVVRRLTPLECERLQGFPDNWTNIGDWVDSKGKTHKGESDSPRYKALGNSIALPFWQWMAERMMPYLPENPTMASLFDGIGGFPLVFSRCGCKPVWASEIEEFPIAVTKRRFPEE